MIWAVVILSMVCVTLFALLVFAGKKIEDGWDRIRLTEVTAQDDADARVISILTAANRRYDAALMRSLADRYESVEIKHDLTMLTKTLKDDEALASAWLRAQADILDPPPDANGRARRQCEVDLDG
jgi:hypothetical protein